MGLDPGYVMDHMEMYEVRALLRSQHMRHRESWEQTRMLAFIMARCAGSKVRQVKDIFSLPWDSDGGDVFGGGSGREPAEPDYSHLERLKAKARAVIQSGALR